MSDATGLEATDDTPRLDLDEYLRDPFAALRDARQQGWLVDSEPFAGVMHHADVRELLSDPRLHENFADFLESLGVTEGPFYEWMAISPLNHDGDYHRRWREVISRAFTPRSVEKVRPYLAKAADELIDGFAAVGECEFMVAFADPYPSLGLCELIGVPTDDRDRFRGWANAIGLGFSPMTVVARLDEIDDALTNLLDYTGRLADERRRGPGAYRDLDTARQ